MASTAAQPAGGTRTNWIIVLIALSVLFNYIDRGAIGVAAPLMKEELRLSATGFGFAVAAFSFTYAPLCLVVGWLCDRFCVYRMFSAGVALWAMSTVLTGFVGGLVSLIVLRLLLGLGESIAFPGSTKVFAAQVPPTQRGIANAAVGAALAFGPALGTLLGGTILGVMGWRPIFWVFGAVTLLWLAPWWIASGPLRSKSFATPVVEPVPMKQLARVPTVWVMGLAHFLSNYGFYFVLAWMPLYLTSVRHYSIGEMTLLTTLGFSAQAIAALTSGHLSDRQVAAGRDEGELRRAMMIVGQLATAGAILGVAMATSVASLAVWLVVFGVGAGLVSTNLFAVAQVFAGPRAAGSWMGLQNSVGNLSGIIGPILTGLIVDRLGSYDLAFYITAAIVAFGAFCWWKLVPQIRPLDL